MSHGYTCNDASASPDISDDTDVGRGTFGAAQSA